MALLPNEAYFQLGSDFRICRLLNGMWQVSGAHGYINSGEAIKTMLSYHEDGFSTWDLADHYGPAEDFIGRFRAELEERYGEGALRHSQALTKWVPQPGEMPFELVQAALRRACRRMNLERLDMLQLHWWDYRQPTYLEALHHLAELRQSGGVLHLGLTNFDTAHLAGVVERGIPILTNQVQFSVLDRRPEVKMLPYCQKQGIWLLCYGVLCGGFISRRYLDAPEPATANELNTASLRKYKHMIDEWGGWALFQKLLFALQAVAQKHGVSLPNVAVRYILEKPQVAGVIIGVRLGLQDHRRENARVFQFHLDEEDYQRIHAVTAQANPLYQRIGDCGAEYRR